MHCTPMCDVLCSGSKKYCYMSIMYTVLQIEFILFQLLFDTILLQVFLANILPAIEFFLLYCVISKTEIVEQELFTLPGGWGGRVARSLVFCVIFCRSLFVLLSPFLWTLYCLSFDIPLLVSSNFSYDHLGGVMVDILA
jgi:hypothetical protein